jgi:hypothetical protein
MKVSDRDSRTLLMNRCGYLQPVADEKHLILMVKPSRTWIAWGRFLIYLTAFVLVVMPWTEYWWQFDHSFHGGQDLEFSILSLLTFFCLLVVLSRSQKRGALFLLASGSGLQLLLQRRSTILASSRRIIASRQDKQWSYSKSAIYNPPIQI